MIASEVIDNQILGVRVEKQREIWQKTRKIQFVTQPSADAREIEDLKVENGIKTYLRGERYAMKFFTPTEAVNATSAFKRLFAEFVGSGLIGLFLFRGIFKRWLERYFELFPIIPAEEYWSEPVKELRRVLRGKIDGTFLDAVSVVLENDMAYRYRFQDIAGEIDKNNKPLKELDRLLGIIINREHDRNVKLWKRARRFLWVLKIKEKEIGRILKDMDIEKVKLSEEDIYWSNLNTSYDMRGIKYGDRIKDYEHKKNFKKDN